MPAIEAPSAPATAAPKPGQTTAVPVMAGEIHVTAPTPGPGTDTHPESPKGKLFSELGKKARGAAPRQSTTPPAVPPEAKPGEAAPEPKPAEGTPAPKPAEGEPAKPAEGTPAAEPAKTPEGKSGKVSPWKLVEEYKGKLNKVEAELAEVRKGAMPTEERQALETRAAKAEGRVKELEQHLTFVDYSKTEEFAKKYVAPYEAKWKSAMTEMQELSITDPATGQARPVTANDLLTLVNMPLQKAREVANELFGDFADDVMAHRKDIRSLFDAQQAALEDAKKNGAERIKQAEEQAKAQRETVQKQVSEGWKKENDAVLADDKVGVYFRPKEGDENWNKRLSKGFELVDRAFAENPLDPKHTPEERASIIRRHAAIRNRAASWGALRGENDALSARVAELEKELGQYKASEPGANGAAANAPSPGSGNAKENMFADLRKRAR